MEDSEKKTIQGVLGSGEVRLYDIQKQIQDNLYRPSEQVLATRNQIRQGTQEYNRLNQFISLATGRRPGPPMKDPTFNDGITKSQITSAKESALIQFARSLEKIREKLGRNIKKSEVSAIARAYNIGPEGLEKMFGGKFFDYVGVTPEEERAETEFIQEQDDRTNTIAAKNAEIKEKENINLVINRLSRMLRKAQENDGVLTYDERQEIRNQGMKEAEMLNINPADIAKIFEDLLPTAPATKEVYDTTTGQTVLASNYQIANDPNRYVGISILNDNGKLSTDAQGDAIVAYNQLGISYEKGTELVSLMTNLGPLEAMIQNPDLQENIVDILRNIKEIKKQKKLDLMEEYMRSKIYNSSSSSNKNQSNNSSQLNSNQSSSSSQSNNNDDITFKYLGEVK